MHRRTAPATWRAAWVIWAAHAARLRRRARDSRHVLVSHALVVIGLAGMLGGAALVGTWLLGLTLMAVSAGAAWFGLMRDDGSGLPRRGARSVPEILDDERLRP